MARLRLSERTLSRYKDGLELAHRKHKAEALPIIEMMERYFRGDQWPKVSTAKGAPLLKLVVNLILADIKVMLPVLALRNPRVFVKPTKATAKIPMPGPNGQPVLTPVQIINNVPVPVVAAAKAKEHLVNWRWKQLRVTKQVRRCLVDSFLGPFGVMKLGFTLDTEKVDMPETEPAPGAAEPEQLDVNESIQGQSPFAVRWSPKDFRVDTEERYPDLGDAAWIAFGWKARLKDVQRNPRYKNTRDLKATVEVKTDYGSTTYDEKMRANSDDEDFRRVQLWEIHDKREHKILTLAEDHDKALEWRDWPLSATNFLAEPLYFTEHPDYLYGPPDLYQVLGQQDAYNQLSAMSVNHAYRFLRKYMVQRGSLDEKEMYKFLEPIDGAVIEIDGKPQESITPVPDAPIPTDWYQNRIHTREDHDRVSGVGDFVRGVAEKVDTATEASLIQSNLNVRTNDSRDLVEDFAERIARQLLTIDAQTVEIPSIVPVIGPDGAVALGQFLNVQTRETLLTEVDVDVEIGSMQPVNEVLQKREMLEVYGTLRNDPLIDQFELRRELLARYHTTLPDGERLLIPKDVFQQVAATMGVTPGQPGQPSPTAPKPQGKPRPATSALGGPRPGAPRPTGGVQPQQRIPPTPSEV